MSDTPNALPLTEEELRARPDFEQRVLRSLIYLEQAVTAISLQLQELRQHVGLPPRR